MARYQNVSILDFTGATDDGGDDDNCAIRSAKLQSIHHHQQTYTQLYTGRMPFLALNQQCQSTEGKNITFQGLAYLDHSKLTWGSSNLLFDHLKAPGYREWRVAKPLVSPLTPVPPSY